MMLYPIDSRRDVIYRPVKRPGFTAWTTAFDYGNGRIGLSFKETIACPNPDYAPPALEDSEVIGAPVSYGSVCCGDPGQTSYRVYLASDDCGKSHTDSVGENVALRYGGTQYVTELKYIRADNGGDRHKK